MFKAGKAEGQGRMTWADGTAHDGAWVQGQRQG